jgi:hypothetical protein
LVAASHVLRCEAVIVSGVVSLTMSYQLVEHVAARFNWHRIVTDYNRDTDIVLFGLGIRF